MSKVTQEKSFMQALIFINNLPYAVDMHIKAMRMTFPSFFNYIPLLCSVQNVKSIGQLNNKLWESIFDEIWVQCEFRRILQTVMTEDQACKYMTLLGRWYTE